MFLLFNIIVSVRQEPNYFAFFYELVDMRVGFFSRRENHVHWSFIFLDIFLFNL